MDDLRRAAAASAKTHASALEMLAQFTCAQDVEKWQDLMQPTKAQQPPEVQEWLRSDVEDLRPLLDALAGELPRTKGRLYRIRDTLCSDCCCAKQSQTLLPGWKPILPATDTRSFLRALTIPQSGACGVSRRSCVRLGSRVSRLVTRVPEEPGLLAQELGFSIEH